MIFFLINYIFSEQHLTTSSIKHSSLLQDDELECIYDRLYSSSINSNSVICLVRCTFNSIKTTSAGGAVVISLRNRFGTKNYIDNCKFINCNSKNGSAIYLNIEKNFSTEIFNSQFENNSVSSSGGAIYIFSKIKCKFQMENCTFNENSAKLLGGSIYFSNISYSFINCQFKKNICQSEGGAISSKESSGFIIKCQFANNFLSDFSNYLRGGAISFECADASFTECKFTNNSCHANRNSFGGGISLVNASKVSCEKCYFLNNYVISYYSYPSYYSYGGAISIKFYIESSFSSSISISGCKFTNNTAYSEYSYGGAIFYESSLRISNKNLESSLLFKDLTFTNNAAYSQSSSMGGAISIKTSFNCLSFTLITSFQNVTYTNNTAYSKASSSLGGAIWFSDENSGSSFRSSFKANDTFNKNIFINNTAYSESTVSYGGAIALSNSNIFDNYNYKSSDFIEDSSFINNTVYSNSTLANGGAIYIAYSNGIFRNCTFKNSIAKTFLKIFMITGDEPRSLGGAIYLSNSNINFTKCSFINNTGLGDSPLHISTGKGGAIYASNSKIVIEKSNFTNNTLINFGHKFDIDCYTEGGACYFSDTNANLIECYFLNNTATLRASVNSVFFSARIYGGAVYSHSTKQSLNCINCIFTNNFVIIPDHKEKEFSGAIYLNHGTLDNCIFNNNAAYNGGDIRFDQTSSSLLKIMRCSFIHNITKDHQIRSLIHFRGYSKNSSPIVFSENRVDIDISSYLFDGEMEESSAIIKIKFNYNCISPFNKGFFKSDEMEIYNENGNEYVSFESAFESSCSEYVISHTLPTIVPTKYVKTPTQSRPIISFIPKSITPSRSPTKTRPVISFIPKTITPSRTQVPTRSVSSVTKTQTHSIQTLTRTKSFPTQTDVVITIPPTKTMQIIDDNQPSGLKGESREFRIIFVSIMCVLAFQIILVLLYIASFIMRCIDKHNRNEITNPLIDLT